MATATPEIRALTLWQPWATLVATGAKRIETRSWPTKYRGLLAIHAGKNLPREAYRALALEPFASVLERAGIHQVEDYPLGAIIAVAHLGWCVRVASAGQGGWSGPPPPESEFGDYSPGRYGWRLIDVRALPEPIPCTGRQRLWRLSPDLAARVLAAVDGRSG